MKALREAHQVRVALGIALAAFDLDASGAFAIPRAFQLRDHHGLLELRHGAEDLANEVGSRRVVEKGIGLVGRDQLYALLLEHRKARLLHDQVALPRPARSPELSSS